MLSHSPQEVFSTVVLSVAGPRVATDDILNALRVLGPDAEIPVAMLAPDQCSMLVDRFVRNLRTPGVHGATELHRQLMEAAGAAPKARWKSALAGPKDVMALRNQLKQVFTHLGLGWDPLSRVQSAVCGLGRWVSGAGGGQVELVMEARMVRCELEAKGLGTDVGLVEQSPIVTALKPVVENLVVRREAEFLVFQFLVTSASGA